MTSYTEACLFHHSVIQTPTPCKIGVSSISEEALRQLEGLGSDNPYLEVEMPFARPQSDTMAHSGLILAIAFPITQLPEVSDCVQDLLVGKRKRACRQD